MSRCFFHAIQDVYYVGRKNAVNYTERPWTTLEILSIDGDHVGARHQHSATLGMRKETWPERDRRRSPGADRSHRPETYRPAGAGGRNGEG